MNFQKGEDVGGFEIVGALGAGAMGTVYRARRGREEFALKTVQLDEPGMVANLHREIRILSEVEHPHIVRVVDHGTHQGVPWYAMELVRGNTLKSMLDSDMVDSSGKATVLGYLGQVARGLAFLHGEGIVHRDLKPSNIVVADGRAVIVDFGLSAMSGGFGREEVENVLTGSSGTPMYMAPEQATGHWVDGRADLYSLGCILFEALYGEPPFTGPTAIVVMVKQVNDLPDIPADDEGRAAALTRKLLAKSPSARPFSAALVAHELEAISGISRRADLPVSRLSLGRAPLCGREREFHTLCRALENVHQKKGGAILITGESGVGKSRLLIEASIALKNARLIASTCPDLESPSGFLALGALFQTLYDEARSRGDRFVEAILGSEGRLLVEFFPILAELPAIAAMDEPPPLDGRAGRERLFLGLARILERWSERDPLAIVIDDLHWADQLSLDWLEWTCSTSRFSRLPVLLVLSSRPTSSWETGLQDIVLHVQIDRLGDVAMAELVEGLLGGVPPVRLTDVVTHRAEGIPVVATEFLRTAAQTGVIAYDEDDGWGVDNVELARLAGLGKRGEVAAFLTERMAHLSNEAAELANLLALAGAPVPLINLQEWEAFRPHALDALVRADLLEVDPFGRLVFCHASVRASILERIADRKIYHLLAAHLVEDVALRAHHLDEAEKFDEAGEAFLEAARLAARQFQHKEALALFRRAILRVDVSEKGAIRLEAARAAAAGGLHRDTVELAQAEHFDEGFEGYLLQAIAYRHLSEFEKAQSAAVNARRVAATTVEVARAQIQEGIVLAIQGRLDDGREMMGEAIDLLEGTPAERERAHALFSLGVTEQSMRNYVGASALFERCLPIFEKVGDELYIVRTMMNLGIVYGDTGERKRAIEHLVRALDGARQMGARGIESAILSNLGLVYLKDGALGSAHAMLEVAIELNREIGDRMMVALSSSYLGDVLSAMGRYDEAERALQFAARELRNLGLSLQEGYALLAGAQNARRRGDDPGPLLKRAAQAAGEANDPYFDTSITIERGLLAAANGKDVAPFLEAAQELLVAAGLEKSELSERLRELEDL